MQNIYNLIADFS